MKDRYIKNTPVLSEQEIAALFGKKVIIVGCGGLGGYIVEALCRLGVGNISLVDDDIFDETNLNRQMLCLESNLGTAKVEAAKQRIHLVNKDVSVRIHQVKLTQENADTLLDGHDLIIDAVDNVPTRLIIQHYCNQLHIPLIHGAIDGWNAQIATVFPGDDTLYRIYESANISAVSQQGPLTFIPLAAASIEVAEAIKVLLNKATPLRNKLLIMNLFDHQYDVLTI